MGALSLNADGLLPAGIHVLTVEEVEELFVHGCGDEVARSKIFRRWVLHTNVLRSVVPISHQWIDGSFVTDKQVPGDIDVVSFVSGSDYDALTSGPRDFMKELVSGGETRKTWGVDSYMVATYAPGSPLSGASGRLTSYWQGMWESVRDDSSKRKGFVEVRYE
jgi:hypothetical protein